MAADLQQLIQTMSVKHRQLATRYHDVVEERDDAKRRIVDLEYTVKQQKQDIERLSQQVEFLTVVSTVMPDRDDVERSRELLSGLVREIDKCIKDLTD
ncbi:MAG: hypothetical protein NC082_05330 [Clostridiales bacterium]|nr:hypothetical protein [Clostridiales bacterium]